MVGDAAEAIERPGNADRAVEEVLSILHTIFDNSSGMTRSSCKVPAPLKVSNQRCPLRIHSIMRWGTLQVCCTKWGSDPYAYGSYSSVRVGSSGGDDYDILAENIGERVFFAGTASNAVHAEPRHTYCRRGDVQTSSGHDARCISQRPSRSGEHHGGAAEDEGFSVKEASHSSVVANLFFFSSLCGTVPSLLFFRRFSFFFLSFC